MVNATATLNIFVPTYMQETYSVAQASLVASFVMVGVTVGKILLGVINDRSTTSGLLATITFGCVGLLLLMIGHTGIDGISLICGFLFGWAYTGVSVQTPTLVRSVFGNRDYAPICPNVSMAIAIGGAIDAGGWGLLAEHTSYCFIISVGIALLLTSGIIGMYALSLKIRKKEKTVSNTYNTGLLYMQ